MNAPVLMLNFNRPEKTRRIFEAVRAAKPKRLYFAVDGPRATRPEDIDKCALTAQITDAVDWNCEVRRRILSENLGCGRAVSGAISWFFEHEESGIILEDDTLPDPSFFPWCSAMLEKYEHDQRVDMICGHNVLEKWGEQNHFFSNVGNIWGWATWRRSWGRYNFEMSPTEISADRALLRARFGRYAGVVERKLNLTFAPGVDTWDFQWWYCRIKAGTISCMPQINLVYNIGMDIHGTHVKDGNSARSGSISVPDINGNIDFCVDKGFDKAVLRRSTLINSWLLNVKRRYLK